MSIWSAFGKYSDPLILSTFCYVSPILKWINCIFCSSIYTQYKKIEISHLHSAPLAVVTASSLLGYDATSFEHLYLGSFSQSSQQILSSSVRLDEECRCTAISRSLQRCSNRFKSGLWLSHSRTLRFALRCLGCVLRFVVLFEGELLPQSEVLHALEQVFIKDLSVLCSIHLSLDPD